jgi:hypothetical protein
MRSRWLRWIRHSLGAEAMRGGPRQSCLLQICRVELHGDVRVIRLFPRTSRGRFPESGSIPETVQLPDRPKYATIMEVEER